MNYTLQQILDLLQPIIIVGLIIQNVLINKEIKNLKIKLKTIIKLDRWMLNMQATSIKEPKSLNRNRRNDRNE